MKLPLLVRWVVAMALVGAGQHAVAAERLMQTWHPWQMDSVLVVWALTQVPRAQPLVVESVVRGTPIPPEQAIDTPESPYRRNGRRTAFEEAVRQTGVSHPCLPRLHEAVRVVELASWRKPEYPAVEAFEARLRRLIPSQPMRGGLDAALEEVEKYCKEGK